jgi:glutamyl-tRNA synthetase/glutamyl-Q tRNA(Asp) synthetase
MRGIISRFAPAPTGFLHLGHVVNAVLVWKETRARSGRVLLRIEDHDRQRSRRLFEEAIVEDLAWLGFEADEPAVRQSERGVVYADALGRLRALGLVYACDCTRAEIAHATAGLKAGTTTPESEPAGLKACATTAASDPEAGTESEVAQAFRPADSELRYPGTCRDRGLAERPGCGLRVRLEPSVERFVDLRLGPQEQRPSEQCGDLLARDRDGNWTYQFAAAVDDYVQGVTLVIRGVDLLASTGRQIQLARLLGRDEPPAFLHHPLIMKSPHQKLSKSDGDTGIRELRAKGWTAEQVIARALALTSQ